MYSFRYAHRFAFVQPQEAVEYLCLLRGRGGGSDYDKQQEKACMNEYVDEGAIYNKGIYIFSGSDIYLYILTLPR